MGGKYPLGVKPASKTSIQISFTYDGKHRREFLKLKPTPANLRRAASFREAVIHAIATGTFDYATSFPDSPVVRHAHAALDKLGPYLEAWLVAQKSVVKNSTWHEYRKTIHNFLLPALGEVPLTDVGIPVVKLALENRGDITAKTMRNLVSPLRVALNDAVDEQLIKENPLANWRIRTKGRKSEFSGPDPFTVEEQQKILAACGSTPFRNQVQFAFWTGLRTSELVALEWPDVDFERGRIRVERALTQAADEPEEPKTKAGTRYVKLLQPARRALELQTALLSDDSEVHDEASGNLEAVERTGPVFGDAKGRPWTGDRDIRRVWEVVLKRAGVRYRKPYQTRHTFASMLLSAGENPIFVANQMGHADTSMIFRVYGKWINVTDDAGNKAVALFYGHTQTD